MARGEILETVVNQRNRLVAGASIQINYRDSLTPAVVYTAETGASELSNPLTSDSLGRIEGWLEEDAYVFDVSGAGITPYSQAQNIVALPPKVRRITVIETDIALAVAATTWTDVPGLQLSVVHGSRPIGLRAGAACWYSSVASGLVEFRIYDFTASEEIAITASRADDTANHIVGFPTLHGFPDDVVDGATRLYKVQAIEIGAAATIGISALSLSTHKGPIFLEAIEG